MLYPRCPTCGIMLSHIEIIYETKIEEIEGNEKLTEKEKEKQKRDLLIKLSRDYCCGSRLLTYVDMITVNQ